MEITEGDGIGVRGDIRHVLGDQHRIAHQPRRLPGGKAVRPQEAAIGILHLAHGARGLRIHHEARIGAVFGIERIDEVDDRIRGVGRGEIAIGAGRHIAERTPGPKDVVDRRMGQEALGLVDPVAKDEGLRLGPRELVRDALGEPALDIEGAVVQKPLARLRHRRKLVQRDRDAVDLRRTGLAQRCRLRRPARAEIGMVDEHVKRGRLDLHHIGDGPQRRGRFQHAADAGRGLGIDEEAAIRVDLRVQRLALENKPAQPVIVARAQIGREGLLMRRVEIGGGRKRRASSGDRFAIQHGQSLFLLLQLRCHLVLKALELAQKPGKRGLHLLGRSAGRAFPGPSLRLGRLHPITSRQGLRRAGLIAPPVSGAPPRKAPPARAGRPPRACRPWPRPAPREASGR